MSKIKVKDFRDMSKIGEIGTFEIDGQTIEYKKAISFNDRKNIILSVIANSYNEIDRNIDEIFSDLSFKYLIIINYIANVTFPKIKFEDESDYDVQAIVDICESSGIYSELVKNISYDYAELCDMLYWSKEEKLRENSLINFLYNMLDEAKNINPENIDKIAKQLKDMEKTDSFKALQK